MAGQPPIIKSPEEFELIAEQFFADCEDKGKPVTITGLALALGFCSRQSFYDYEKMEEFSYTVKKCRLRVESEYEIGLRTDKAATGAIFALKNMGWEDKQETKLSGEVKTSPPTFIFKRFDNEQSN